uniref:Uncharacterized protein n=1 Tax=Anopheles atroparvus TaxID=41427 RepID=A0A182JKT6_ANOAO
MEELEMARKDATFSGIVEGAVETVRRSHRTNGVVVELKEDLEDAEKVFEAFNEACKNANVVKGLIPREELCCRADSFCTPELLVEKLEEQHGVKLRSEEVFLIPTSDGQQKAIFKVTIANASKLIGSKLKTGWTCS